jgi:pimeloyl-ACP methyl ester carboxylesterase
VPDARVQSAIDHWAPRFTGANVDHNDFLRTASGVERWEDWLGAWDALGDRHADLAREAEAAGRDVTAGDAWLRASAAYHFAKFVWVLDMERVRPVHAKSVAALYDAHRLLGNTVRRIEAPLDGFAMPANLRLPDGAERPPLVILIPGLDSTKEELVNMEGAFLARGMATISLDGPGQGESTYDLPLRHDYEAGVTALLDALQDAGDLGVDLDRVGAVGQSMGGYLAPRAACFEPRIRVVAGLSGAYKRIEIYDALPPVNHETFIAKTHATTPEQARDVALKMDLTGVLENLEIPALFVTGDRDRLVPWQQTEMQAKAAPQGEFVLVEGGTHVVSNYPYLLRALVSDWMADHLAVGPVQPRDGAVDAAATGA